MTDFYLFLDHSFDPYTQHDLLPITVPEPVLVPAGWSLSIIIKPPSVPIESLNIAIFYESAWPDKIQLDAVAISPLIEYFALKLGVVGSQ